MLKKSKKILVGVMMSGLVLVTGVASQHAFAKDNTDSAFNFTFSGNGTAYTDGSRRKEDSSAVYMKLNSIFDGDPTFAAEVVDGSGNYFAKRYPKVTFAESTIGRGQYLYNNAYEEKGYGVFVKVRADGTRNTANSTWKANGVWSPDSL